MNRLICLPTLSPRGKKVVVGFDGYVDSIVRVMRSKDDQFNTLTEFGDYIQGRANRSGSVELRQVVEKIGGNMPIFSNALSRLGVDVTCIGAMGYPEVLPIFQGLGDRCDLKTVSNPGYCQALEFDDGKLMLASNEDIDNLSYRTIVDRAGKDYLREVFQRSDLIVLLNWSEMKQSLSIWHGLEEDFFSRMEGKENKQIFMDLSDCSIRPPEDVKDIARLIGTLSRSFDVSLSLNQNEAEHLARASELPPASIEETVSLLHRALGCRRLIVHLVDRCYCAYQDEMYMERSRYIEHPVLSTGGGDNFNAGFVFGLLCGLDCGGCIRIANSVSSFYVSHGYSPAPEELRGWINEGVVPKAAGKEGLHIDEIQQAQDRNYRRRKC